MAILISKVKKIHNLKHIESNLNSETKAYLLVPGELKKILIARSLKKLKILPSL